MKVKILRKNIIKSFVNIFFMLLPFSFLLDKGVFKGFSFLGMGIINILLNIIIIVVTVDTILNIKKSFKFYHVLLLYILFLLLNIVKIMVQDNGLNAFFEALPNRLYYFLMPLVYIMLKNRKVNLNEVSNILIKSTVLICPISLYMFFTSNYFGMVDQQVLLVYDTIGTPFSRMLSVFGSPLVAGSFFTIILLLMIYEKRYKLVKDKILFLLNFVCLCLTFSRAALIIFFATVILKYLLNKDLKPEKKLIALFCIPLGMILIIVISKICGIYFWDFNDLFNNIRFKKWIATFSIIMKHLFFGNEFSLHISFFNTTETTLSDNSFLLFIGYYGIVFTSLLFMFATLRYKMKQRLVKRMLFPVTFCAIVFCFFYDFVQLFPSNYMLLFLYIYLNNTYRDKIMLDNCVENNTIPK